MDADTQRQRQLAAGLERIAAMVRSQSWREDGAALPPTQRGVLTALTGQARGLRAGALAAKLGVSPASISDSLRAMEAKGWLKRGPDPADARASLLRLSAAGRRLAARLEAPDAGLTQLVAALPEGDAAALLRAMQLLIREGQARGLLSGLRTCLGCAYFRPFASGEQDRPHVCSYVGAAFGDASLRTDCPEHQPHPDPDAFATDLARFRDGG